MVDAPAPEHGGLVFGLGVAGQLEHVELRVRPDGHERQPALLLAVADGLVGEHVGLEDVAVEGVQAVGVAG